MKKTLQHIIICLAIFLAVVCVYNSFKFVKEINTSTRRCGVVSVKFSDEVQIKYGTRTDLILIINWSDGERSDVTVTPTTYHDKKIGDSICFSYNESQLKDVEFFNMLSVLVGFIVIVIIVIVSFVALFSYVFGKNE